ncbi:MAG: FadR/GntR family transcriptional regulator [Bacilli bacterium]
MISQENFDATRFVAWYNRYKPEIFHLLETRLALEPMAASLAAERATEEQIQRLERCHEGFIQYIMENNVLKITLGDESFHDLIFEATHNPLLQNLHTVIKKMLTEYRKKVFSIPKEAMKAVSQHDEILRCIRERNPDAARENMIQHLLISKRGLLEAVRAESAESMEIKMSE